MDWPLVKGATSGSGRAIWVVILPALPDGSYYLQARAIVAPDWAEAIDYPAFVELSIRHDKVNSWL